MQLTRSVLDQLRALGAYTYTNQVVVADVLCLHPSCLADGLERCLNFPLGLAHLLATTEVRVFLDSSFLVLHEMIRWVVFKLFKVQLLGGRQPEEKERVHAV